MSVLSDASIMAQLHAERLVIRPFNLDALGPCSYDVTLGEQLQVREHGSIVDLYEDQSSACVDVPFAAGRWLLEPGRLYLGALAEFVRVPDDLVGFVHGRSTLARSGIVVHQQAGLLDSGWHGHATLEITVIYPTWLRPGAPIGQLVFERLTSRVLKPYAGRYIGDVAPTPAKPFLREVTP